MFGIIGAECSVAGYSEVSARQGELEEISREMSLCGIMINVPLDCFVWEGMHAVKHDANRVLYTLPKCAPRVFLMLSAHSVS